MMEATNRRTEATIPKAVAARADAISPATDARISRSQKNSMANPGLPWNSFSRIMDVSLLRSPSARCQSDITLVCTAPGPEGCRGESRVISAVLEGKAGGKGRRDPAGRVPPDRRLYAARDVLVGRVEVTGLELYLVVVVVGLAAREPPTAGEVRGARHIGVGPVVAVGVDEDEALLFERL